MMHTVNGIEDALCLVQEAADMVIPTKEDLREERTKFVKAICRSLATGSTALSSGRFTTSHDLDELRRRNIEYDFSEPFPQ